MKMKTYRFFLMLGLAFLTFASLCACEDEDKLDEMRREDKGEENIEDTTSLPYFHNHPLPKGKCSLRVLAIGNSYTIDALWFVKDVLEGLGVDPNSYSVYCTAYQAASLQYWWEVANTGEEMELLYFGGARMDMERGTLSDLFAQKWDVITFQQNSDASINYQTFNPWLRQLIDFALQYCQNKDVTFAWQMAWSYNDHDIPEMSNYERWLKIASSVQQMVVNDGIDVVIPAGTAIQDARCTSLSSESQLMRDSWHLDRGVGRYIATCTWLQTLFAPVYGLSVYENHATLKEEESDTDVYPSQHVTDANRALCHQCVQNAMEEPFKIVQ